MSVFYGFKCDVCGKTFDTGIRMSGDKKSEVHFGKARHAYRVDFCNECFERMMAFVKAGGKEEV